MTLALLPAAGKSTRMGRPKLLLPLGGRTVLEHAIAALQAAGVEHILVVAGPHVPDLGVIAHTAGAHVCQLTEETPDMRSTVQQGLRWLEDYFNPGPDDALLLVPADHPTLDAGIVRQLVQQRTVRPEYTIFVPTFEGRRGHPVLLTWGHVAGIRSHPPGQGLNTYLRQHAGQTCEIPVASAEVLCDLDTPEDYARLGLRWPG